MGNRSCLPSEGKPTCDASSIAHATVIGAEGSVNNPPDCLPARSRGGTPGGWEFPRIEGDACRRGGRSYDMFGKREERKTPRDTRGRGKGYGTRVTDLGDERRGRAANDRRSSSRARLAGSILGDSRARTRRARTGRRMRDACEVRSARIRKEETHSPAYCALTTIFRTPPRAAVTS